MTVEAAEPASLQAVQLGDDVDAWYRRYGEAVYRRCLRLTRDQAAAWDLTQEAFLRAHRFRASFRGESTPVSWLFTIADRCFFDLRRAAEPVDPLEVEAFVRSEEDGIEGVVERQQLVARLLSRVPDDVRQIVVHRYFDELEHGQIAARLGVAEKTVRRKLERFLESARKLARRT